MHYKYHPHNPTPLEKIMNRFWEKAVLIIPMNVAPNTVTLIGLLAMVLSYVPMLVYDISLTKTIPNWTFSLAALLHFLYQTADALDGKQARRTHASSPLGHLFDHGCDAFSTGFLILGLLEAFQLGDDPITAFGLFATVLIIFWIFSWNQCHSTVLLLNVGGVGIVEAQYLIMFFLLVTGYYGQAFWLQPTANFVPAAIKGALPNHTFINTVLGAQFGFTVLYTLMVVLGAISLNIIIRTLKNTDRRVYALKQNLPFLYLLGLFVVWSQTPFYAKYRAPVYLIFSMYFSLITSRLIISGMTKEFSLYHRELVALTAITPILYKEVLFANVKLPFPEDKAFLVFIVFLTLIAVYSWAAQVMKEISDFLGIHCFSVYPRSQTAAVDAVNPTKLVGTEIETEKKLQ